MQKDRVRSSESNGSESRTASNVNQTDRYVLNDVRTRLTTQALNQATTETTGESRLEIDSRTFSAAVDAVLDSESGVLSWKLAWFAPAIASIAAGVVLQRRQNKLRRYDENYKLPYAPF